MAATRLVVEVVEARNLLPKDGTGTSSAYVVVDFDGQRRRTRTVPRDLNPSWNEALEFAAEGAGEAEQLEVDVYHDRRVGPSRRSNFLGRLRLDSSRFVRKGEEALMHFPLQRKSFFSWVRGELGLRIYYVADEAKPSAEGEAVEKTEGVEKEECTSGGDQPPEALVDAEDSVAEQIADATTLPPPPPDTVVAPEADPQPSPTVKQSSKPPPSPPPLPLLPPPPLPSLAPEPAAAEIERSSFDLVEKVHYLFVRILRVRSLPAGATFDVRLTFNGRQASTGPPSRDPRPEWDRTFAFPFLPSAATALLELAVWDSAGTPNRYLGGLRVDASEAPMRDPPDTPLAAQWHRLEGGGTRHGELMLAVWAGTQADESFHDACMVNEVEGSVNVRSKVYLSPKLWYLRVSIIEAQDLPPAPATGAISVHVRLGFQALFTQPSGSPAWNEDLLFVVAEPFGDANLELSLHRYPSGKEQEALGTAGIPLSTIERRVDDRHVASRWIAIDMPGATGSPRLHVRVCLDGGYNVADEPPHAASDYRPAARQLWSPPIGTVEIGIIGCRGLLPTRTTADGRGTADAYVVAKYGPKWARTRTVSATLAPSWNEQYTWEVHEVSTAVTIAVFDEATTRPLGRVRIRVSTLSDRRPRRAAHPLLLPGPGGVTRGGELELVARFTLIAPAPAVLALYSRPLLPSMHHARPIPAARREALRLAAARLVAARLARADPPLRREVVAYVLEAEAPPRFSFRKVRRNWRRLAACIAWADDVARWIRDTAAWRSPASTLLAHVAVVLLACFPALALPAIALHVAGVTAWRYRKSPRPPAGEEGATADEMDEELDGVPSAKGCEALRARYERLRAVGARLQELLGDAATQAERAEGLLSWRDPRATFIFVMACLLLSAFLLVVPARLVVVGLGFYFLRHPVFREEQPSPPAAFSFFSRLPPLDDGYV